VLALAYILMVIPSLSFRHFWEIKLALK